MSPPPVSDALVMALLRIPMRGYEALVTEEELDVWVVTNPHEGL